MPSESQPRRRDARDNAEKLRAAAVDAFSTAGLDASLEGIARAAGVRVGTLYNHFGSREGLIDAVMPDIVARTLETVVEKARAEATPRDRLATFVHLLLEIQEKELALADTIMCRFPDAEVLMDVREHNIAIARELVHDARRSGSLSPSFTADDLISLLWLGCVAGRAPIQRPGWRRVIEHALNGAWTE